MRIDDLLAELQEVERQVWFIHRISELDVTDDVLKAHLDISEGLYLHPLRQFVTETEEILVEGGLI